MTDFLVRHSAVIIPSLLGLLSLAFIYAGIVRPAMTGLQRFKQDLRDLEKSEKSVAIGGRCYTFSASEPGCLAGAAGAGYEGSLRNFEEAAGVKVVSDEEWERQTGLKIKDVFPDIQE